MYLKCAPDLFTYSQVRHDGLGVSATAPNGNLPPGTLWVTVVYDTDSSLSNPSESLTHWTGNLQLPYLVEHCHSFE